MKTIRIEISPDGEVVIEAVGFKGADCLKATKAYEEALGPVKRRMKRPEFYQSETTATQVKVVG